MEKKKYQIFQFSSDSSFYHLLFYLLFGANLLSIIYFLLLGYYNRLALDDYCYLTAQNGYGFLSPFTFWYQNWQGRFSPILAINLFIKIYQLIHSLLPETILFLVLFIGVLNKLIKKIVPLFNHFERLNLSTFIISVFIINNYEFNTFYWLNASAMYFGGVLFLLVGINVIFSPGKNFWAYLLLIFSAVYVGSSSETFAFIWSAFSGLTILCYLLKSKFNFRAFTNNTYVRKSITAFIFCFLSFLIMYMAPGNAVRLKITALSVHQEIPLAWIKIIPASLNAFVVFCLSTLLNFTCWILLSMLFFYLGIVLRDKIDLPKFKTHNLTLITLCFITFLWICLIPTVYVQGEIGPKRALTHIAFYITCYVVFLSFISGLKCKVHHFKFFWFCLLSASLWTFIVIGRLTTDIPEVRKYAQSEDKRIAYLKTLDAKFIKDTLLLEPLYLPISSGISKDLRHYGHQVLQTMQLNNSFLAKTLDNVYYPIKPNELRPLPYDFVNDCICRGFHLEFHLKLQADSTKTKN